MPLDQWAAFHSDSGCRRCHLRFPPCPRTARTTNGKWRNVRTVAGSRTKATASNTFRQESRVLCFLDLSKGSTEAGLRESRARKE